MIKKTKQQLILQNKTEQFKRIGKGVKRNL